MDKDYVKSHIDTKFVKQKDMPFLEKILEALPRFTVQDDECSFYVKKKSQYVLDFCPKEGNKIIVINVPDEARTIQVYLESEPHWTAFNLGNLRCAVYHKFNPQFSST